MGCVLVLPRLVRPRPAEARMSSPTEVQLRVGGADGLLEGLQLLEVGVDGATPLFSRPSRKRRASYMLRAFRSTLFTITD